MTQASKQEEADDTEDRSNQDRCLGRLTRIAGVEGRDGEAPRSASDRLNLSVRLGIAAAIALSSPWACARATPGASRATTLTAVAALRSTAGPPAARW